MNNFLEKLTEKYDEATMIVFMIGAASGVSLLTGILGIKNAVDGTKFILNCAKKEK